MTTSPSVHFTSTKDWRTGFGMSPRVYVTEKCWPLNLPSRNGVITERWLSLSVPFSLSSSPWLQRVFFYYHCKPSLPLSSNYNRASNVGGWLAGRMCGNQLLERLMSPSPKSHVMFASAFSWIGDFFIVFTYAHFVEYMNMHAMSWCRWTLHPCSSAVWRGSRMLHAVAPSRGVPACYI